MSAAASRKPPWAAEGGGSDDGGAPRSADAINAGGGGWWTLLLRLEKEAVTEETKWSRFRLLAHSIGSSTDWAAHLAASVCSQL